MRFKPGCDRQQAQLLPPRVEDYVDEHNPVRFIDAFVDAQDLQKLEFRSPKVNADGKGRPSYNPGDLTKLYIYCYLNGVRSSRKMEAECHRNVEVMWLVRQLRPDHKTIADFRKDNAKAFKALMRQFTLLCRQLDLFGRQLLAIDGTKIKGRNARDQNWSRAKLEKQLREAQEKLEEYLKALDETDRREQDASAPVGDLKEKIRRMQEQQAKATERLKQLKESGQSQVSATDPDSRGMKGNYGHMVGYNVQAAVDGKHHLLAVLEATNQPTDRGQLATVAEQARQELGMEKDQSADIVADSGYVKGRDIKRCQEMGMEPHLPLPAPPAGLYGKQDFHYDRQSDAYRCPAGAKLKKRREVEDKGNRRYNYENRKACASCELRARCTKSSYRTVSHSEHEENLERMRAKVAAEPEKLSRRKELVEHVFGTLKHLLPGGFLVKGMEKVGGELSLAHLSYNLKRALAEVGLGQLMAALKTSALQPVGV